MNVEIGTEAVQFPEKEYINGIFVAVCFDVMKKVRVNSPVLLVSYLFSTRIFHLVFAFLGEQYPWDGYPIGW
jgi:hypothetical protein